MTIVGQRLLVIGAGRVHWRPSRKSVSQTSGASQIRVVDIKSLPSGAKKTPGVQDLGKFVPSR